MGSGNYFRLFSIITLSISSLSIGCSGGNQGVGVGDGHARAGSVQRDGAGGRNAGADSILVVGVGRERHHVASQNRAGAGHKRDVGGPDSCGAGGHIACAGAFRVNRDAGAFSDGEAELAQQLARTAFFLGTRLIGLLDDAQFAQVQLCGAVNDELHIGQRCAVVLQHLANIGDVVDVRAERRGAGGADGT